VVFPSRGWYGKWDKSDDYTEIAILCSALRKTLEERGFYADATLGSWKDRGWLEKQNGEYRISRRVNGIPAKCFIIPRRIIDSVLFESPETKVQVEVSETDDGSEIPF
jgi:Ser-tRNA(Ala) deacylase AlaX